MFKAFLTLFSGNLFSKVLGLVREMLLAWAYGLSATAAAIRIALAGIFIPMNLLTQELLSAGFIPLYKTYQRQSTTLANQYFNFYLIVLGAISIIIVATLYPLSSAWIYLLASGFSEETATLATQIFQWMLFSIPPILLTSTISYQCMANGQYFIQSIRPAFQNLGMITAILLSVVFENTLLIGIVFTITQTLLLGVSFAWLARTQSIGFVQSHAAQRQRFRRDLWQVMRPMLVLPLALQGYIILERNVASWFNEATVAALDMTKFITETSMALLAIPMGLVLLSNFSGVDRSRAHELIDRIVFFVSTVILPAACVLLFAPETVIRILFQRGAFTADDTVIAANVLQMFSIGLLLHTLNYQMLKLANAFQESRLYSMATVGGLITASIILLNHSRLGLNVFGLAYIGNGLMVTITVAGRLYSLPRLIGLLSGATLALFISWALSQTMLNLNLLQTIGLSCAIAMTGILLNSLPFIRKFGISGLRRWIAR